MRARRLVPVLLALLLTMGLSACVDPDVAPTLPSASPLPSEPNPTPTVEPTQGAEPLDVSCEDLVDPDVVYAVNPNLALLDSWSPDPGSFGELALLAGGVTCHWVLESGGGSMDVSAARLSIEQARSIEAEAASGQAVAEYPENGYFEVRNGVGVATVVRGTTVIFVESEQFALPEDAAAILASAAATIQ